MKHFVMMAIAGVVLSTGAQAAYVVDFTQVGANVVATGSGSVDLSQLTYAGSAYTASVTSPAVGNIGLGGTGFDMVAVYSGVVDSASFGSGGFISANTASGNIVVLVNYTKSIFLPDGYISGADLGTSTAVFDNATFQSLGLTPGAYVAKLGGGTGADTFSINIPAVPEPASWALMLSGAALIGGLLRRSRSRGRDRFA